MTIRLATVEDSPFIQECIHELSVYEGMGEKDHSTVDGIRECIFEKQYAQAMIAEIDGNKVGFAVWNYGYSAWQNKPFLLLIDLYVRPAYRGSGLGKLLLKRLSELSIEKNCCRVEWYCLKNNASGLAFYHSIGASVIEMDEWDYLSLSGEALRRFIESIS